MRHVVVGNAVHLTIDVSAFLHGIFLNQVTLLIHTEQTVLECSHPQTSQTVALDIHHDEVLILGKVHTMGFLSCRIDPGETLTIGAYPDMSLVIFLERHHRSRNAFYIVFEHTMLAIETIEAVLISTYPSPTLTIDEGADDTGATQLVALALLIAHIAEALEGDRLFIDTFLQQTKPEVTTVIFSNGVDLALLEIDLHAVEGIVQYTVVLGLIDGETLSVVADDDTTVVVAVEC